jgi:hypothetical protein
MHTAMASIGTASTARTRTAIAISISLLVRERLQLLAGGHLMHPANEDEAEPECATEEMGKADAAIIL